MIGSLRHKRKMRTGEDITVLGICTLAGRLCMTRYDFSDFSGFSISADIHGHMQDIPTYRVAQNVFGAKERNITQTESKSSMYYPGFTVPLPPPQHTELYDLCAVLESAKSIQLCTCGCIHVSERICVCIYCVSRPALCTNDYTIFLNKRYGDSQPCYMGITFTNYYCCIIIRRTSS